MYYTSVTNENFNIIKDFHSQSASSYVGNKYGYYHKESSIIFYTTFLCCPCIYYLKANNQFCFSFDMMQVKKWADCHNIPLTETDLTYFKVDKMNLKPSVRQNYRFKEILFIEQWKQVEVQQNGQIIITPYDIPLFSLDLTDNLVLFQQWIDKYKNAITQLNEQGLFVPTLTGGLDTRYLTSFYRQLKIKSNKWLYKMVKPDGKNQITKGQREFEFAEQIWQRLHHNLTRVENIEYPLVTLSGMFNENTRMYEEMNNPQYIYKYIQHAYSNERPYQVELMPYIDDIYLMFKQERNVFRCLMCLLFASDLLDIPFIGTTTEFKHNPNGQLFFCVPYYQIPIYKSYQIIHKWFPKQKEDD